MSKICVCAVMHLSKGPKQNAQAARPPRQLMLGAVYTTLQPSPMQTIHPGHMLAAGAMQYMHSPCGSMKTIHADHHSPNQGMAWFGLLCVNCGARYSIKPTLRMPRQRGSCTNMRSACNVLCGYLLPTHPVKGSKRARQQAERVLLVNKDTQYGAYLWACGRPHSTP